MVRERVEHGDVGEWSAVRERVEHGEGESGAW